MPENKEVRQFDPAVFEGWLGINEATAELGFKQAQYTRRLVLDGKLEAEKVQMKGFQKWLIDPAVIEAYKATVRTRSGMRRFILRIKHEDTNGVVDAITSFLTELAESEELEFSVEPAYKPKAEKEEEATDETDDFLS